MQYLKIKIFLIGILCMAGSLSIHAQLIKRNPLHYQKVFVDTDNFGFSYLEILEENYQSIPVDSVKLNVINDLAYYWHTRNLEKSVHYALLGLKLAREKELTLWEGKLEITLGAALLRQEKLDTALMVLNGAINKVRSKDLPHLYTQIGYVYERKGQVEIAANYARDCLELGRSLGDKRAIAVAYSDISNLFWKQSKYEKGLEYGLKSLSFFEDRRIHDLDYDFTLYVVGNNYLALEKYEEAQQYYEHAIAIGERYGFYNNLSDIYISLTDLYAFLQKYEKAEQAGKKAVRYGLLLKNDFLIMRAWLALGKLQYIEGKYQTAVTSLQRSIAVATKDFGDNYYLSQAYETLGKALAGTHNYKEAYKAFAEYDRLKSEFFTEEADQRISLLQTEFEVAQKESTIQDQETLLNKQRLRQTLITIIASLLLLLLILTLIAIRNNRKKNELLEKQNKEKEFLLKEIHHRVKNNLGIVSSLLALQSAQIKDQKVVDIMSESRNRVYSMSMIHQRLYQGENLSTIEMKDYFIHLTHHIIDVFGVDGRVELEMDMAPIEIDIDTAVPLGLIVNELMTNALKYAFPKDRKGSVRLGLKKNHQGYLLLNFSDDGIGQKEILSENDGFGSQLIKLLTIQLDGEMERKIDNGTAYQFIFKDYGQEKTK